MGMTGGDDRAYRMCEDAYPELRRGICMQMQALVRVGAGRGGSCSLVRYTVFGRWEEWERDGMDGWVGVWFGLVV